MKNMFAIVPQFLKNPQEFFGSVQRNEELKPKALSLFISTVVFLLIYGFITGLSHSFSQGLSTAVKMPILFLLTLAFTLPALYFFALALLNIQFSVAQAGVVVLSGIGVTAFLLLGLSPVTLFFVLTSSNYPFFQLLAVLFVAISGEGAAPRVNGGGALALALSLRKVVRLPRFRYNVSTTSITRGVSCLRNRSATILCFTATTSKFCVSTSPMKA